MTDTDADIDGEDDVVPDRVHPMRTLGRVALGVAIGLLLVPALLELAKVAGDVTAFRYQGF